MLAECLRFIAHVGVRWPASTMVFWGPMIATFGLGFDYMIDLLMTSSVATFLCYEQVNLQTRNWALFVPLIVVLLVAHGYGKRQREAGAASVSGASGNSKPSADSDSDDAGVSLRKQASKESTGRGTCVALVVFLYGTLLVVCLKPFDCVYMPKRLVPVVTCETAIVPACALASVDQASCEDAGNCTFTAGAQGSGNACTTTALSACAAAAASKDACETAGGCTFNVTTPDPMQQWQYACSSAADCYTKKQAASKAAFDDRHGVRVVDDFALADHVTCGINDADWPQMISWAVLSTVVLCVILPILFTCAVAVGKDQADDNARPLQTKKLQKEGNLWRMKYSFFYLRYRPSCWYWELVVMGRKFAMALAGDPRIGNTVRFIQRLASH